MSQDNLSTLALQVKRLLKEAYDQGFKDGCASETVSEEKEGLKDFWASTIKDTDFIEDSDQRTGFLLNLLVGISMGGESEKSAKDYLVRR